MKITNCIISKENVKRIGDHIVYKETVSQLKERKLTENVIPTVIFQSVVGPEFNFFLITQETFLY